MANMFRWLGALWLAAFTLVATFVAKRFWQSPMLARFAVENSFSEDIGLVGGLILVAWHDVKSKDNFSLGPNSADSAAGRADAF
jgi:uncharacterized membrane protein YphA (DoxX/SURF4 family)